MRSRVVLLLTALLAPLVAVLGVPTSTAAPAVPAAAAAAARANNDPGFLVVWDNNVENLETAREYCRGDYQDLLAAMRRSTLKPDLFLVQQVSGTRQLRSYVREISRRLGETYRGVIANPSPRKMGSPCKGPKSHQTNAIVYRDARFDPVGAKKVFRAESFRNGRCAPSPQDRTQAVKQRLLDVVSGKTVVVASIHWATGKSGGTPCAGANARDTMRKIGNGDRARLYIVGGDFNISDRSNGQFRGWYRTMNGDLGKSRLRDVVYAQCQRSATPRRCLDRNATTARGARIDFLFAGRYRASRLPRVSASTLGFRDADRVADRNGLVYSDHKAIRARVYY